MKSGLFRAFSTVGGWTMASRILGLFREMLLSRAIGASGSPIADAFLTAFRLPNMFRRFLAEGAFNAAFVPMFSKRLENEADAHQFAQTAFSGLLTITILLVVIVQIFTPAFVLMLSWGFLGDARFAPAISYTHLTIFYIIFMSLGALMSGVLNSYNRFSLAAAAPVLLNIVLIAVLALLIWLDIGDNYTKGLWLSWAVLVSGILQFALLYIGCKRMGMKFTLIRPRWNDDMKHLVKVAIPATMTNGVAQINLVIGAQIASSLQGAQAWLYYADRFYQLPLGVIGIAIGVVLLPALSKLVREEDVTGGKARFNDAVLFSMLFTLPSAVALFVIPIPLVQVLYEGGQFTHNDSIATARALAIYAIGLPAFVLQKSLLPLFFAREDTKTPLRYAVWSMVINIVLSIGLMRGLGYMAPVWGSVISAWAMLVMLWQGSRRYGDVAKITKENMRNIMLFAVGALAMGVLIWALSKWGAAYFAMKGVKWLAILGLIAIAMAFYFGVVLKLSHISMRDLKAIARR